MVPISIILLFAIRSQTKVKMIISYSRLNNYHVENYHTMGTFITLYSTAFHKGFKIVHVRL